MWFTRDISASIDIPCDEECSLDVSLIVIGLRIQLMQLPEIKLQLPELGTNSEILE